MRTLDVIDFKGDEWHLLIPPLRWNRPKTELWLLVTNYSAPGELRNFIEIPVPCFTEWFVDHTYCYCDIGAGGKPCISRENCDARRARAEAYWDED